MVATFEVRELATLLGTTPRRIEGWVEQGFIKPAVPGQGPGRRRRFNLENLVHAALLLELQGVFGEKSRYARPVVKSVAASLFEWLPQLEQLSPDLTLCLPHSAGEMWTAAWGPLATIMPRAEQRLRLGQLITLLNVPALLRRVRARLDARGLAHVGRETS